MGVYLSSPITEKISEDNQCDLFTYGASSMQGWRMTQEDSHNCLPDFDTGTRTSLFAVYDGHGGSEVAKYCSAKLPDYIKGVEQYKKNNLSECLQDAFLGFDETLTHDDVISELKVIAGDDEGDEEEETDAIAVRKEADILYEEASMPIEELRAKYSGNPLLQQNKHLKGQKQPSPMIRAKRSRHMAGEADSVKGELDLKDGDEHPDNDNNLNTEKEMKETNSVKSESDQDVKLVKPDVNDNDKCEAAVSSSSEPNEDVENNVNKSVNDTDKSDSIEVSNNTVSTSSADNNLPGSKSAESSSSSSAAASSTLSSSGSSGQSSEAASSSSSSGSGDAAGDAPSSTSSAGTSQQGGSSSGVESEPSGSGEPGSSGAASSSSTSGSGDAVGDAPSSTSSAGTSQQGGSSSRVESEPSGSGEPGSSGVSGSSGKKSGLTLDDIDSEDDDSSDEDEAYNSEDYEDVDDDDSDDDDDDDDDEIGGSGIFGYVKNNDEDDDGPDEEPGSGSGCTAVVALLRDKQLVVANAGDSRCVLCRDGKAIDLSVDHKPEDKPEKDRIEAAGGQVTEDGRVNGGLNLSRAIGDHYYKKNISIEAKDQMISAFPDIECATLEDKDEFMVLACDGIWNYMTSQEVVDYVRERLKDENKLNKPSLICEEMFDHCLAPNTSGDGTGCDNMTCIIVVFKQNHCNNKKHDLDSSGVSEPPEKRQKTEEEVKS